MSATSISIDPNDLYSLLFSNQTAKKRTTNSNHDDVAVEYSDSIVTPYISSNIDVVCSEENGGRKLVATRDVDAGECLFVTAPSFAADLSKVYKLWSTKAARGCRRTLEEVAEDVLCDAILSAAQKETDQSSVEQQERQHQECLDSINLLVGSEEFDKEIYQYSQNKKSDSTLMELFTPGYSSSSDSRTTTATIKKTGSGNKKKNNNKKKKNRGGGGGGGTTATPSTTTETTKNETIATSKLPESLQQRLCDKTELLKIIRRNAFGPDFHQYSKIESVWNELYEASLESSVLSNSNPYHRVLGLYPLAAMINHSCTSNALRVFAGEYMCVHSSQKINKGDEIVWSYVPAGIPYVERSTLIRNKFGFVCQCHRCTCEQQVFTDILTPEHPLRTNSILQRFADPHAATATISLEDMIQCQNTMEEFFSTANKEVNGEVKRFLRVGYLPFYIHYFNVALKEQDLTEDVLNVATQVHFALVVCNNASTEHLSILHLIYDLVAKLHTATADDKSLMKLRFWTEQLKKLHLVRYGPLGHDVEHVRQIMKHTKLILRNPNGFTKLAEYTFI